MFLCTHAVTSQACSQCAQACSGGVLHIHDHYCRLAYDKLFRNMDIITCFISDFLRTLINYVLLSGLRNVEMAFG